MRLSISLHSDYSYQTHKKDYFYLLTQAILHLLLTLNNLHRSSE